jgi:rhamnosyltransferase
VSIVIPTLNAGPLLEEVLTGIRRQESPYDTELIAIDSGSSDGTVERLHEASASIVQIPRAAFNHGTTRNAALERASGQFAVLMTQDAVPAGASWLSALVEPLLHDDSVAGSFARQIPLPGASRLTDYALSRWVAARVEPRLSGPLDAATFKSMTPVERHLACAFDNVCACIRKDVWTRHPFKAAPIAEDLEWAKDVLLCGYKIAYAPAACVRHSHERGLAYELRRTYLVHQRLAALFGLTTIPTATALVRAIATTLPVHLHIAAGERRRRVRAAARAAGLACAWPLGQYLGARSRVHGRDYLSVSGI